MATLIQRWRAADGTDWDTQAEALNRDLQCLIYKLLREQAKSVKDEDAKHIAAVLAHNRGAFCDLLDETVLNLEEQSEAA